EKTESLISESPARREHRTLRGCPKRGQDSSIRDVSPYSLERIQESWPLFGQPLSVLRSTGAEAASGCTFNDRCSCTIWGHRLPAVTCACSAAVGGSGPRCPLAADAAGTGSPHAGCQVSYTRPQRGRPSAGFAPTPRAYLRSSALHSPGGSAPP